MKETRRYITLINQIQVSILHVQLLFKGKKIWEMKLPSTVTAIENMEIPGSF